MLNEIAYVHEALGYSESQAYERVRACELEGRVPEVREKLESGEPTLSVVAKLASHVRREGTDLEETRALAMELSNQSRYVTMPVRRAISLRSGAACEYVDASTGKRCSSRFAIQWDHIESFGLGGPTTLHNLRHFCWTHNQLAAIKAFGLSTMERWVGKG